MPVGEVCLRPLRRTSLVDSDPTNNMSPPQRVFHHCRGVSVASCVESIVQASSAPPLWWYINANTLRMVNAMLEAEGLFLFPFMTLFFGAAPGLNPPSPLVFFFYLFVFWRRAASRGGTSRRTRIPTGNPQRRCKGTFSLPVYFLLR